MTPIPAPTGAGQGSALSRTAYRTPDRAAGTGSHPSGPARCPVIVGYRPRPWQPHPQKLARLYNDAVGPSSWNDRGLSSPTDRAGFPSTGTPSDR
ncbi:hypothetical protein GCM10009574_101390 [Streptomyces asiaticus]|uniref:Uncharacterized protein n=1 Tax=Streptomyces rhizosphaericus TaxID=114699 RepID=A0ABN1RVN2_9ACTN